MKEAFVKIIHFIRALPKCRGRGLEALAFNLYVLRDFKVPEYL